MTMSTKVQIPSLVSTMSTYQQKELSVVEGSACNYYCSTLKLASCAMLTKMLRTTTWVHDHSLPWAQRKK
jgi:hypothetical protein